MAGFSDNQLEEVRSRADIVEVIGAHVRLRKAGRNFVGLCPFHNEKTPSFSVNRERGFFYCFGCGVGGTVFNFLMKMEGMTFPESVRSLANRYGIKLPETHRDPQEAGEREAMRRAAEVAAQFFTHVLWEGPAGAPARGYLERRGIDLATAKAFKLGFAPAGSAALAAELSGRGLLAAGSKIGLVKGTGDQMQDMFRARLMFPISEASGRVIAFGGRVLDDRLPKYINSPESPLYSKARNLYGLAEARAAIAKTDRAIVVEGYIDAIALWQAGFKETVASLGTSLTVDQLRLLSRYTRNILACFDGDNAGHTASLRALRVFLQAGLLGRGIFIPQGFDPDTLIRQRGAQSFAGLVDSAELLVDYFVRSEARAAGESADGRIRAAKRVAEMLALITNEIEFNVLTRKAAEMLKVDEQVLRALGRKSTGTQDRTISGREIGGSSGRKNRRTIAEIGVLAVAVAYPELRNEILTSEIVADFEDSSVAALAAKICREAKTRAEAEAYVAQDLPSNQQSMLWAQIPEESMESSDQARKVLDDYRHTLELLREQKEVKGLLRIVPDGKDSRAQAQTAQEVIMLRRRAQDKSRSR